MSPNDKKILVSEKKRILCMFFYFQLEHHNECLVYYESLIVDNINGLCFLMPLSTIFQLYRGGQFYRRRKPENLEKTTYLPEVSD